MPSITVFTFTEDGGDCAAKVILRTAMKRRRVPAKVILDACALYHRAVAGLKRTGELPEELVARSSKDLNNLIEQDHRRIKQRLRPMLGLKFFGNLLVLDRLYIRGHTLPTKSSVLPDAPPSGEEDPILRSKTHAQQAVV